MRRRRLAAGLPAVLDDVARALRAGASLRQAIAEAGASARGPAAELLAVRGVAGWRWASRWWSRSTSWAATSRAARCGSSPPRSASRPRPAGRAATAVEAVAATLRERHAASQEIAAHSAQARLSAVVIALLPVAFPVWCVATDDRAAAFLLASPAGWVCLVGGLGLLGAGAWWMARIVGSAP